MANSGFLRELQEAQETRRKEKEDKKKPLLPAAPPPDAQVLLDEIILNNTFPREKNLDYISALLGMAEPYKSDESLCALLRSEGNITEQLVIYFNRLQALRQYRFYCDTLVLVESKVSVPIPQNNYYLSLVDDDNNYSRAVMMTYLSSVLSSPIGVMDHDTETREPVRRYALRLLAQKIREWCMPEAESSVKDSLERLAEKLERASQGKCWNTSIEFYEAMMTNEAGERWDDLLALAFDLFLIRYISRAPEKNTQDVCVKDIADLFLPGCYITQYVLNEQSGILEKESSTASTDNNPSFLIKISLLFDRAEGHYDIIYTEMNTPGMAKYLRSISFERLDYANYRPPQAVDIVKESVAMIDLDPEKVEAFFLKCKELTPWKEPSKQGNAFTSFGRSKQVTSSGYVQYRCYQEIEVLKSSYEPYTRESMLQLLDVVLDAVINGSDVCGYENKKALMLAVFPKGNEAKDLLRQLFGVNKFAELIQKLNEKFSWSAAMQEEFKV